MEFDRNRFNEDLKKAREACEKAGVGWPGWRWSTGVDLVGKLVLYRGRLVKVTCSAIGGFVGDEVVFSGGSMVSQKTASIPTKYDPCEDEYYRLGRRQQKEDSGYIQLKLF